MDVKHMHAERAVADLKDLFAKKEAEIRDLRKEVEAGQQRVQLVHASIHAMVGSSRRPTHDDNRRTVCECVRKMRYSRTPARAA